MNYFRINGFDIKNPTSFELQRYKVSNLERNGAGYMCGNLIAKKLKFCFKYDAIDAYDLDRILDILWESNSMFFRLDYQYQGIEKHTDVYPGEIPSELHKGCAQGVWKWKNVNFDLIER